jgi:hypothetical protein
MQLRYPVSDPAVLPSNLAIGAFGGDLNLVVARDVAE